MTVVAAEPPQNLGSQPAPAAEPMAAAELEAPVQEFEVELTDVEAQLFQQMADGEREAVARAQEAEERSLRLERLLSRVLQQNPGSQDSRQAEMIQSMLRRPGTEDLEALSELLGVEAPPPKPREGPPIDASIMKLPCKEAPDKAAAKPTKVQEQNPLTDASIITGQANAPDQAAAETTKVPEQNLQTNASRSTGQANAATAVAKVPEQNPLTDASITGQANAPDPAAAAVAKVPEQNPLTNAGISTGQANAPQQAAAAVAKVPEQNPVSNASISTGQAKAPQQAAAAVAKVPEQNPVSNASISAGQAKAPDQAAAAVAKVPEQNPPTNNASISTGQANVPDQEVLEELTNALAQDPQTNASISAGQVKAPDKAAAKPTKVPEQNLATNASISAGQAKPAASGDIAMPGATDVDDITQEDLKAMWNQFLADRRGSRGSGETEQERMAREAHNSYMRYYRSIRTLIPIQDSTVNLKSGLAPCSKSSYIPGAGSCPPEIRQKIFDNAGKSRGLPQVAPGFSRCRRCVPSLAEVAPRS